MEFAVISGCILYQIDMFHDTDFSWTIWILLLSILTPQKNQENKNTKIQKDLHKESLEDCPSWWWKTKITSRKVEGQECARLEKLSTQFWLTKDRFSENSFIWGKEIQIWTSKDSMKILEGKSIFTC